MIRFRTSLLLLLASLFAANTAFALKPKEMPDTFLIPERAVIASGDADQARGLVAVLYDKSELHFSDPGAPRFLFLDRKGKVALGIGGYVKGTMQYDFDGSIDDGASFVTYDIPVPGNPAQRSQFYGNANHSTIFLQLVGHNDKIGYYQVYLQTQFSDGGPKGYGLKLKQAYVKAGYVTAGLANSTFVDAAAGTPEIEDQGPSGEMSRKNVLVRYAPRFSDNLSAGIGVEMPSVSVTHSASTASINQRVPDIPVYLQYEWGGGNSHVRLSALWRNLSYRDLATASNKFRTGWAVQLSGVLALTKNFTLLAQGAGGQGYGTYLNDLDGNGFDLVYSATDGKMITPKMANVEVGATYQATSKLSFSAIYSQVRTFQLAHLGGDTYRRAQYVSVNGFYDIITDLRLGLAYNYGQRKNYSGETGHANSIMAMMQFSF